MVSMQASRSGLLFAFLSLTLTPTQNLLAKNSERLNCEVAIVGGGAGGLHTAFRLGPKLGSKVCLFEKENELGGRIYDVSYDADNPDAPRMGVGARRIMETQTVLFNLAAELGLQLETPPLGTDLIQVRGKTSFSKDDFVSLYPGLPLKDNPDTDQETWLYDQLRLGPERAKAGQYPDFRSYVSAVVSPAGLDYLHDMTRFRADFEYPLDARSYMDYLDEEWDVCCVASYPVGGMSAFIRGMEERARAAGVRIFKGEAIHGIHRKGKAYELQSAHYQVAAKQLVIAVPPSAFPYLRGDVPARIAKQKAFQDIIGVKVATITQWWPTAWWKDIRNPSQTEGTSQVWRAWTTDSCVNFIEIPLNPDAEQQNVTRSVYDDDQRCVDHWEKLAKTSMDQVEAEIHEGLTKLFDQNGASLPETVSIPKPLKTHVQIWPAGWHWLRAGATHTNAEVAAWSLEPLPGEAVALVGEAYYPNRSGWSDGAYKSSIQLLNTWYKLQLTIK
jgi:monoamine oxidase